VEPRRIRQPLESHPGRSGHNHQTGAARDQRRRRHARVGRAAGHPCRELRGRAERQRRPRLLKVRRRRARAGLVRSARVHTRTPHMPRSHATRVHHAIDHTPRTRSFTPAQRFNGKQGANATFTLSVVDRDALGNARANLDAAVTLYDEAGAALITWDDATGLLAGRLGPFPLRSTVRAPAPATPPRPRQAAPLWAASLHDGRSAHGAVPSTSVRPLPAPVPAGARPAGHSLRLRERGRPGRQPGGGVVVLRLPRLLRHRPPAGRWEQRRPLSVPV
jgi:hypothetical protein